jgi:hypothetical protein
MNEGCLPVYFYDAEFHGPQFIPVSVELPEAADRSIAYLGE